MEQQDHKNRIDFLGGFMMKKVFAILCTVLTIALMLTGCGGQKAENHYTIGIGQFGPHGSLPVVRNSPVDKSNKDNPASVLLK